jgi:hypothetical protein
MKPLEARDLLSAWEKGLNQASLQRPLVLLAAAFPGISPDTLVKMSVGQRDRGLLQMRECLFGQKLQNTAVCPQCTERLEWENQVADFLLPPHENTTTDQEFELDSGEYSLLFRLPNSLDIDRVAGDANTETAQQILLSRCLLKASRSGAVCELQQLPDSAIQQLTDRIEALDSQADIQIELDCPACSHRWVVLFDIANFLWKEVNAWAEQMLQTVYRLAAAYGWSEREILSISPVRRQLYLGLIAS